MRALVLLSGGLDSLVALSVAISKERTVFALSFDYGQRHLIELKSAEKISNFYAVPHKTIKIDTTIFSDHTSPLINHDRMSEVKVSESGISSNYVPARNTIFLSYAAAFAEILNIDEIYIGANKSDHLGFPDCRPAYFQAFQGVLDKATKRAHEGSSSRIVAPLSDLNKQDIVQLGKELNAPLDLSWSCYYPTHDLSPCKKCDACVLRDAAFERF